MRLEGRALLDQAVDAVRRGLPSSVRLEIVETRVNSGSDAIIRFTIGNQVLEYVAEIKPSATGTTKMQILIQKQRTPNLLLVTRYLNPRLREDFVKDGVEYLDTAGNVFLHQPPLFILVKGNKVVRIPRSMAPARVFLPAGLRLVFGLLVQTDLINRTYREIAEATGVALGTVAWVMQDLKLLGFLVRNRQGKAVLMDQTEILERWVTGYNERLRIKQLIGRYQSEPGWPQQKGLRLHKAWWGGAVAAARLTGYIKPEIVTVYTMRETLQDLISAGRLRNDERGNVEILEGFWGPGIYNVDQDTVHPILIYADLLATGDRRNIETAKMIYEREITRLIGKD